MNLLFNYNYCTALQFVFVYMLVPELYHVREGGWRFSFTHSLTAFSLSRLICSLSLSISFTHSKTLIDAHSTHRYNQI